MRKLLYALVGHYSPTDSTPFVDQKGEAGKLDIWVGIELFHSRKDAEAALSWYPDGVIVQVLAP